MASVALSIFLLAIFGAAYRFLVAPPGLEHLHLVLVVAARTSIANWMPASYGERIARVPGVAAVMPTVYFDGRYGSEQALVPAIACDARKVFTFFSDWRLPQDQQQAFAKEQVAMIAGRKTAEKYGWKIGNHIHLSSPTYFNVSLELVLRGIYTSSEDETLQAFHWSYLNEALGRPDVTGYFYVLAQSADDIPRLMKQIDALFRNAGVETRTQPLKQVFLDFLAWLGNVKLVLLSVSAAVVFAILLIVANTMAMSIRERTTELAVLRALGFRTRQVLGLLAAESLAISFTGAAVGSLAAWLLLRIRGGYTIGGMLPVNIQVDVSTLGLAAGVSIAISLCSTLIPAYRASRVNIAQALRFVG